MALTLQQQAPTASSGRAVNVAADFASKTKSGGLSPMVVGLSVMAASIVIVQLLTMGMMLVLTDVSVLAAFGLGLYCAFWLGIGFGTIFGSAVVFGRDH